MVEVIEKGAYLYKGESIIGFENEISKEDLARVLKEKGENPVDLDKLVNPKEASKNTMAYDIIMKHNTSGDSENLKLKFDALTSHDLTFVGIIQTAKASGLQQFPIPYVLTNCHNSLCAVGGTINEDDHVFGLSAVKKYGGIYVPANVAVIHQYMREEMASCGSMILGSDSHTRYGALGTMAIGEGGGELVKQLLSKTYDVPRPEVIAIYLEGKPRKGVGPQDVALAIIGATFKKGVVKNKVMEFVGPGVSNLSVDFRNGIDVMTTETTCLSSIWTTDEKVKEFFEVHKRPEAYKEMAPGTVAYYDGLVKIDLSKVEPMIALPFHPSNVYTIAELNKNPEEILKAVEAEAIKLLDNPKIKFNLTDKIVDGRIKVDQGIIAGCSGGTFENIYKAARILKNASTGDDYFNMNVYPASQPVYLELLKNGALADLTESGVIIKPAFCGPCFGAGDTPSNNAFSIRHTTRNFPNREGSKPGVGQISSVALMDALSIAATALNGGYLTPATEIDFDDAEPTYNFDRKVYENRINQSFNKGNAEAELKYGPSIADWPEMYALEDNVLLKMVSVIHDPVTTTDELIPSGETSSYRSDPNKLSEFTLSRRDPEYVGRAKATRELEKNRQAFIKGNGDADVKETRAILAEIIGKDNVTAEEVDNFVKNTSVGSTIFAVKPGDGSAREQAASCQKVLGGLGNISIEYATKRYRSNLINWGMIPFTIPESEDLNFEVGDYIFVEGIKEKIKEGIEEMEAQVISIKGNRKIKLQLKNLTNDEKDIILAGSLINYNASK
ncbi:hydratase [Clostridium magnum]|uniref:2,3-dimethylmalate dehydratase large subunit n=1 Tax=Clostridium magnum DSM 2767 TaxID=1121326 RepID=A0A162SX66_9CLOT|nr:hydratase [Clostridium magnum]KZL91981.1 2,3-dimethylmalate dehydratase large subunit [Clostridium magnum DSM 2767]SHH27360.1 aconitate hydratase [Clostridium magnum DSM 2767]